MTERKPPKVRVLPPELASQIAAGEVVERPASVVKELVENALDAQAGRVVVQADEGGIRRIRVSDDGWGMAPEDAALALQPHATSKISSSEDLASIATLGFRGEALASIASVSRLALTTRTRDQDVGVQVRTEGGGPLAVAEVGCGPGTTVEVSDLFFNTPARRKFLKRPKTEAAHIQDVVTRIGLARPEVHFLLELDGRVALQVPRHSDWEARARELLGRRAKAGLYASELERGTLRVRLLAAGPEDAVRSARSCYLFVNGRAVRDKLLLKALTASFAEVLPQGGYPVAVLFVDLPPEEVDVNVHPQKSEVRFRREREVAAAVRAAVRELLVRAPWSQVARGVPVQAKAATQQAATAQDRRIPLPKPGPGPRGQGPGTPGRTADGPAPRVVSSASEARQGYRVATKPAASRPAASGPAPSRPSLAGDWFRPLEGPEAPLPKAPLPEARPAVPIRKAEAQVPEAPLLESLGPAAGRLSGLRFLGQALETFLVFEGRGELVLVDLHAAHERVRYNEILARLSKGPLPRQRLLVRQTFDLPAVEAEALRAQAERLTEFGFEVEPFGPQTFVLKAVPAILGDRDPLPVLQELLERLADPALEANRQALVDEVAASMACHTAVRAGRRLDEAEVEELLRSLERPGPWDHCPHGRPVVIRIPEAEIRRRFRRSGS